MVVPWGLYFGGTVGENRGGTMEVLWTQYHSIVGAAPWQYRKGGTVAVPWEWYRGGPMRLVPWWRREGCVGVEVPWERYRGSTIRTAPWRYHGSSTEAVL